MGDQTGFFTASRQFLDLFPIRARSDRSHTSWSRAEGAVLLGEEALTEANLSPAAPIQTYCVTSGSFSLLKIFSPFLFSYFFGNRLNMSRCNLSGLHGGAPSVVFVNFGTVSGEYFFISWRLILILQVFLIESALESFGTNPLALAYLTSQARVPILSASSFVIQWSLNH